MELLRFSLLSLKTLRLHYVRVLSDFIVIWKLKSLMWSTQAHSYYSDVLFARGSLSEELVSDSGIT